MDKNAKKINKQNKIYKSTYDELLASFSPERKKKYDEGLKILLCQN